MPDFTLRIAHLYSRQLNLYGDRGNIICLSERSRARGITPVVDELNVGDGSDLSKYDLFFIGGGQDKEQRRVSQDLSMVKGNAIKAAVESGAVMLAVCGGYQLMGHYYQDSDGNKLPGLGLLDLWTAHPGPKQERCIGNLVANWEGGPLVGFENHGGLTYLGEKSKPLAKVVKGYGNNGKDGTEGATYLNLFGTYLHGSFLPKNPHFADHLLHLSLTRRYPGITLTPLNDSYEWNAHRAALRSARGHPLSSAVEWIFGR
ncbi:MAG: glutamine amidotransferase [Dehalococcoidia bacterium]|nr:glutamine amidotransferase [Dehalococcoidia bacterium]